MMSRGTVILFVWLIIGAAAAGQRGYFDLNNVNCSQGATMALTIVAGRELVEPAEATLVSVAEHDGELFTRWRFSHS